MRSTPWNCGKTGGEITCCEGELLVAVARFRDDAEAIIRAVNSFEAMREALLAVINDDGLADVIAGIGEQPPFMNQIRAALALADKEQP